MNEENKVMMIPDPLVFRMEQTRKMIEDLEKSNPEQKEFLKIGIKILLNSCDFVDETEELEIPSPHSNKIN